MNKYYLTILQNLKTIAIVFICMLMTTACEDFVNIDPPKTEIVSATVFTSDASAIATVRGIYSLMMTNNSFTNAGIEEYTGIASDEMLNYATRIDKIQFAQNSLISNNKDLISVFWQEAYKYINNTNAILEGLQKADGVSLNTKKQLEGECRFIRAFCYYYLVNLFGDVPYLTTSDYRVNAVAGRAPKNEIFLYLKKDLIRSIDMLAEDYSISSNERILPNKNAARALLARLYLHEGDWTNAEIVSSQIISQSELYSLEDKLDDVFLKNSNEAIWQLKPVIPNANTTHAQRFILTSAPNSFSRTVSLTQNLVNDFEDSDDRKLEWVGSFSNTDGTWYFPYKYKALSGASTEYVMVFRLAEQFLIRAEARAHLNDVVGSQEDMNAIRNRAGLGNTIANDQSSLLSAIAQERKIEFFAEWGHRWVDLIRTDKATEILGLIKPDWQPTDVLFPIPETERLLNTNLSQNPGY